MKLTFRIYHLRCWRIGSGPDKGLLVLRSGLGHHPTDPSPSCPSSRQAREQQAMRADPEYIAALARICSDDYTGREDSDAESDFGWCEGEQYYDPEDLENVEFDEV